MPPKKSKEALIPKKTESKQRGPTLLDLPEAVLGYALDFLGPKTRSAIAPVARSFLQPEGAQKYWKGAFERHFPHAYRALLSYAVNFQELFKEHYERDYQKLSPRQADLFNLIKDYTFREGNKTETKTSLPLPEDHKYAESILNILSRKHFRYEDLRVKDHHGNQLCLWASRTKHPIFLNAIYSLVLNKFTNKSGALILTEINGHNILFWAIICRQPITTIDNLIKQNVYARHALGFAALTDQLTLVEHFLKMGRDAEPASMPFADNDDGDEWPDICNLSFAVQGGNLEIVKLIVKHMQEYNKPLFIEPYKSPLHTAAEEGQLEITQFLLKLPGAKQAYNYSEEDVGTMTPLNYAVHKGYVEVARCLYAVKDTLGEDPEDPASENEVTLLRLAIQSESLDMVNEVLRWHGVEAFHDDDLHAAAKLKHPRILHRLRQIPGADINARDARGRTPLHRAVQFNSPRVVHYLLGLSDIQLNVRNVRQQTPLYYAAERGYPELFQVLLNRIISTIKSPVQQQIFLSQEYRCHKPVNGLMSTVGYPTTLLHIASQEGHVAIVRILLTQPLELAQIKKAVYIAAKNDYVEIFKLLLNNLFSQLTSDDARTAFLAEHYQLDGNLLHIIASSKQCCNMLQLIKGYKLDINRPHPKLGTPLYIATVRENLAEVRMLLSLKADVNTKSLSGFTPLYGAVLYNNIPMIKELVTHGANVDLAGMNDKSPLHVAVSNNAMDTVNVLLEAGADTQVLNAENQTPFYVAKINGLTLIAELLSKHKSKAIPRVEIQTTRTTSGAPKRKTEDEQEVPDSAKKGKAESKTEIVTYESDVEMGEEEQCPSSSSSSSSMGRR